MELSILPTKKQTSRNFTFCAVIAFLGLFITACNQFNFNRKHIEENRQKGFFVHEDLIIKTSLNFGSLASCFEKYYYDKEVTLDIIDELNYDIKQVDKISKTGSGKVGLREFNVAGIDATRDKIARTEAMGYDPNSAKTQDAMEDKYFQRLLEQKYRREQLIADMKSNLEKAEEENENLENHCVGNGKLLDDTACGMMILQNISSIQCFRPPKDQKVANVLKWWFAEKEKTENPHIFCVNYWNQTYPEFYPAIKQYLAWRKNFPIDETCEKFFV